MIDFHNHILPYADDGAENYDISIAMLETSNNEGVKYVCATPHFIPGEYEITRESYDEKIGALKKICEIKNITIEIMTGLEIYINPNLPKLYEEKKIWGINGEKYLLIELPMAQFPIYTEDVLYELRLNGVIPIIAHPERNIRIMKNPELLINLIEQGALAQVNSGSLKGLYGKEIKIFSEELVRRNMVHMIGSDGHNNSGRNTKINDGLKSIHSLNPDLYKWIIDTQYKILNGEEFEVLSIAKKKRKKFFNLF